MEESQNSTLFRNQCILHLQRLTLELKCPLCLKLLKKPLVFPCNHIFCNDCIAMSEQKRQKCPSCDFQCLDQEIRSAPYMESIVRICQSLEKTVNARSYQSSFAGCIQPIQRAVTYKQTPSSINMGCNSREEPPSEVFQKRIYADSQLDDSVNSTKGETDSKKLRAAVHEEVERIPDCIIITDGEDVNTLIKKESKKEYFEGDSVKSSNRGKDSNKLRQTLDCVIITDDEDVETMIEEQLQTEDCKVKAGHSKFPDRESKVLRNAPDKEFVDDEPEAARADRHNMHADHPEKINEWTSAQKRKRSHFAKNQRVVKSHGPSKQGVHCSESIKEPSCNVKSTKHRLVRHSSPSFNKAMNRAACAFCHSSEQNDGTGSLIGFADKKQIDLTSLSNFARSKVLIGHEKCVFWSPKVFSENDDICNLESEVARAAKLNCSSCGKKGASLGCFLETCEKTYHVPCAYYTPEIRWDCEDYLMLCPSHISCKFPREMKCSNGESRPLPSEIISKESDFWAMMPDRKNELVLCGPALSAKDKTQFENFSTTYGIKVSKSWNQNVTHVIASTNSTGACTRTFELLMAILNGKWIVKMDWIKACIKANHLVDELEYEIGLDNHGFHNGPKRGRLNISENGPKLFAGLRFYFFRDFEPDKLNELLELVEAGGGITESKEGMMASQVGAAPKSRYIVYNCNLPQRDASLLHQRLREAVDVAVDIGAGVIRHQWISDSIAGCKLAPFI